MPTEGGVILTFKDRQRLLDTVLARFGGEWPIVEAAIAAYLAPLLIGSRSLVLLDVQLRWQRPQESRRLASRLYTDLPTRWCTGYWRDGAAVSPRLSRRYHSRSHSIASLN